MSSQPSGFLRLRGGPNLRLAFGFSAVFVSSDMAAMLFVHCCSLQWCCLALLTMQRFDAAIRPMRLVTNASVCTAGFCVWARCSGLFCRRLRL